MMKAKIQRVGSEEPDTLIGPDIDVHFEGSMVEFVMTKEATERPAVRFGVPVAQLAYYTIEDTEQLPNGGKQ